MNRKISPIPMRAVGDERIRERKKRWECHGSLHALGVFVTRAGQDAKWRGRSAGGRAGALLSFSPWLLLRGDSEESLTTRKQRAGLGDGGGGG